MTEDLPPPYPKVCFHLNLLRFKEPKLRDIIVNDPEALEFLSSDGAEKKWALARKSYTYPYKSIVVYISRVEPPINTSRWWRRYSQESYPRPPAISSYAVLTIHPVNIKP